MKILKKLTSIFLTATMVTGSILTSGMSNTAYAAEDDSTITLPLKIRDAHLDGFVFEHAGSSSFGESTTDRVTTGLVESTLDSDKKMIYSSDKGIKNLASTIQTVLNNGKTGAQYATYNTLLNALRDKIPYTGTSSRRTYTLGGSNDKPTEFENITSCYGAAYWMTYHLFRDGGDFTQGSYTGTYTIPYNGYKYLVLNKQGDGSYLFQANADATTHVNYDRLNGTIQNSESDEISHGFFPLDNIQGTENADGKGGSHNFGYTLESSGKFVYKSEDNLYFDFTGDDDVYLFINNKLALDLGGQHKALSGKVNLNQKAKELGLEDGGIYDFNFFYMERHTTEANMKIQTNIRVYDAQAGIQKNAYVADKQIPDGGYVAKGTQINYEFVLANKTAEQIDISNLTFRDDKIRVYLSKDIIKLDGIELDDETEISHLTVKIGSGNDFTTKTVTNAKQLKDILEDGITNGQTIKIKGFNYTLQDDAQFVNEVHYTADYETIQGDIRTLSDSTQNRVIPVQSSDKAFVIDYGKPVTYSYDQVFSSVQGSKSHTVSINHPKGDYGTMNNNTGAKTITYTLNKFMTGIDRFIFDEAITSTDNKGVEYTTNLQTNVKMIPATTIYYEDNFNNTYLDKEKVYNNTDPDLGIVYIGDWDVINSTGNDNSQDSDQENSENSADVSYGYDSSYGNDSQDSNGTIAIGNGNGITTEDGKFIPTTAKFNFTGTGLDIVGRTSSDSGAIRVDVYPIDANGKVSTTASKSKIVVNEYDKDGNSILYQIPVLDIRDLTYGKYQAVITVSGANIFTQNTKFYLDGIRIYDPMGSNTEANDKYWADGEAYPEYIELRDKLIDSGNLDDNGDAEDAVLFVDQNGEADLEQYEQNGPNNEIYLANSQSVGFRINKSSNIASIQIGAKSINGDAAITVNNDDENPITLNSATDMYYDITDYVKDDGIVFIQSTGVNPASITQLKITYHSKPSRSASLLVNNNVLKIATDSYITTPETKPNLKVNSATFNVKSTETNKNITMTVKTSTDVKSISILDKSGNKVKARKITLKEGSKENIFKVVLKSPTRSDNEYYYQVIGLDKTGNEESEIFISDKISVYNNKRK